MKTFHQRREDLDKSGKEKKLEEKSDAKAAELLHKKKRQEGYRSASIRPKEWMTLGRNMPTRKKDQKKKKRG